MLFLAPAWSASPAWRPQVVAGHRAAGVSQQQLRRPSWVVERRPSQAEEMGRREATCCQATPGGSRACGAPTSRPGAQFMVTSWDPQEAS